MAPVKSKRPAVAASPGLRIVHVASEVAPWSQTGGLAHVVGALPDALVSQGHECAIVSPLYRSVRERAGAELVDSHVAVSVALDGRVLEGRFLSLRRPGRATVHFLDCPALYDRAGIYGDGGADYWDNPIRFAMLCRAALDAADPLLGGAPDVFHCHDWQTGLLPSYLKARGPAGPRSVFTIHNLAYQGVFPHTALVALGIDPGTFHLDGLEFYGQVNMLKGGVAFADAVTTVSPTYAREILSPAFGCALDGFFAHREARTGAGVVGIVNGIDTEEWNPRTDRHIAANFSVDDLAGKARCRGALLDEVELPADDGDLVIGVVSRFAEQKGIDLIADLAPQLHALGARLVVLGNGDPGLEQRLLQCARWFSSNLRCIVDYDVGLSHRITAGADAVLMPSRFEPCGLNQLYAMRYGTLPIARAVGGLRDTVTDPGNDELARGHGTGFLFERDDVGALEWAVGRAARLHRNDPTGWRHAVTSAMNRDSSWAQSAEEYANLYSVIAADTARA